MSPFAEKIPSTAPFYALDAVGGDHPARGNFSAKRLWKSAFSIPRQLVSLLKGAIASNQEAVVARSRLHHVVIHAKAPPMDEVRLRMLSDFSY